MQAVLSGQTSRDRFINFHVVSICFMLYINYSYSTLIEIATFSFCKAKPIISYILYAVLLLPKHEIG